MNAEDKESRTVRLVRRATDQVDVTIDDNLFATFRGDQALEAAIQCCDSLTNTRSN